MGAALAVEDVRLRRFRVACFDERFFDHVLDVFNPGRRVRVVSLFQQIDDKVGNVLGKLSVFAAHRPRCREDGVGDFPLVEGDDDVVAFEDPVDA